MNKVVLQLWEESNINSEIDPSGGTLHIDYEDRNRYVKYTYSKVPKKLPKIYKRAIGKPINVFIEDRLFNILKGKSPLKLRDNELNNLIKMCEIIYRND